MSARLRGSVQTPALASPCPLRRTLVAVQAVLATCGAAGALQLGLGIATPPISTIEGIGLTSWDLPALWLFTTVAVPAGVGALFAWRGVSVAPLAAVVTGVALLVELLVQMPFLGLNVLQAVFGLVAISLMALGWQAHRAGWC
jgi:hypothetical protein